MDIYFVEMDKIKIKISVKDKNLNKMIIYDNEQM